MVSLGNLKYCLVQVVYIMGFQSIIEILKLNKYAVTCWLQNFSREEEKSGRGEKLRGKSKKKLFGRNIQAKFQQNRV